MEKIKETLHMGSTAAKATGGTRQIPFSHFVLSHSTLSITESSISPPCTPHPYLRTIKPSSHGMSPSGPPKPSSVLPDTFLAALWCVSTAGMFVIKVYRAHKGETHELENVLKTHWDSLHAAGLVRAS